MLPTLLIVIAIVLLALAARFDVRRRRRAAGSIHTGEKRAEMLRDEDTVTNVMMNRRGHSQQGPTQSM